MRTPLASARTLLSFSVNSDKQSGWVVRLNQRRAIRWGHAEYPQSQAARRATDSAKAERCQPSPARIGNQAGPYPYNFVSNTFLVNPCLGPSPCTLETGLRSPLLCWRQGLCPVTKDARQTRVALGTENAPGMKKPASREGGSPTSGPPNAVLADKCSLVGYRVVTAEDTATAGTRTYNGLPAEVPGDAHVRSGGICDCGR